MLTAKNLLEESLACLKATKKKQLLYLLQLTCSRKFFAKMVNDQLPNRRSKSLISIYKKSFRQQLRKAASKRTVELQYEALLAGWSPELATSLEVRVDSDGHYKISYPKELESKILDMEYGLPDQPPSPVMRNFFTRIGDK